MTDEPTPPQPALPACLCGSLRVAEQCWIPLLRGERYAPTAEALMRSRYTAFAVADRDYVMRTRASQSLPEQVVLDPRQRYTALRIRDVVAGGSQDETGIVEFIAFSRDTHAGRIIQHERSQFIRQTLDDTPGCWVYLEGEIFEH